MTFSTADDLERYIRAAVLGQKHRRKFLYGRGRQRPMTAEQREVHQQAWAEFDLQRRAYEDMRRARPEVRDSPAVLAEVAQRLRTTVEDVTGLLPWHREPA
ncbi:MAG TPA: hypothetical protein VMQ73_06895 [Methylomirabilota bacterium]|nr:hypothetical protein [Methylomirabilota bacterium]